MAGTSRYFRRFLWGARYNDTLGLSVANQSIQVEYAVKAVENGGTAIGIRCKDGVVLAVEKIITSKLLKPGANKRIATVDRHVGIVRTTALSPSTTTCSWQKLIDFLRFRYRQASFPMVGTLFPEPEMKHPHGEVYTRAPYRPPRSQIASVAMYKRTHSTPVYDHLA